MEKLPGEKSTYFDYHIFFENYLDLKGEVLYN